MNAWGWGPAWRWGGGDDGSSAWPIYRAVPRVNAPYRVTPPAGVRIQAKLNFSFSSYSGAPRLAVQLYGPATLVGAYVAVEGGLLYVQRTLGGYAQTFDEENVVTFLPGTTYGLVLQYDMVGNVRAILLGPDGVTILATADLAEAGTETPTRLLVEYATGLGTFSGLALSALAGTSIPA